MAEIPRKPPSYIRIRTLKSDAEQMRQAGGEITSGQILGKKMEEIGREQAVSEEAIFEEKEIPLGQAPTKRNKIIPAIIILLIVFLLGGAAVFFVVLPKSKTPKATPSASPTPQYVSLLKNFSGERIFLTFSGRLDDFEKTLSQEFKKLEISQSKEIIFLKDNVNIYPANDFLKMIYSGLPGVGLTDIPAFENDFSFILLIDQSGQNALGYVLKINEAGLSTFALSNLKSKFATAFEIFIEEHSDLLTPQYLENAGNAQKPFLSRAIDPVNGRYLKFSTGKEFYYGFYQNYLIIGTSQDTFQKILEYLLPKI